MNAKHDIPSHASPKREREESASCSCQATRIPLLALRAWMNPVDEGGLPMPREPALLTSAGRMPERSQHRVSEGRMP